MTFKEQIGLWLANRAATDEEFKKDYSKKNKSLDECVKYIEGKLLHKVLEQQKNKKNHSAVEVSVSAPTDDEVYSMCLEYYHNDDIKIEQTNTQDFVKILSMSATTFTEEEKAKMRKEAEDAYKQNCIKQEKAKEKELEERKKAYANYKPKDNTKQPDAKQVEMKPTYKKKETKNDNPQQLSLF